MDKTRRQSTKGYKWESVELLQSADKGSEYKAEFV